MLRAFGFERVGIVLGDIFFVDPRPHRGQEGPEHGVRLELRVFGRGELKGSIYSAQPISVAEPAWRVDLLESFGGGRPFDRTHYHPVFTGWDPSSRVFARELTADPFGWVRARLSDLPAILDHAGVSREQVAEADVTGVREAAPEIADAARTTLERVRAGELGRPPADYDPAAPVPPAGFRSGWL